MPNTCKSAMLNTVRILERATKQAVSKRIRITFYNR